MFNQITYPHSSFGIQFPPSSNTFTKIYGSFSNSQTKTVDGANIPTIIPLDTIEASNGVRLESTTRVVAPITGTYKYDYSLQVDQSTGGTSEVIVWIRINGNDVPRTASLVTLQGQTNEVFPFCSYILPLEANDYVELVFASSTASVVALATAEWTTPTDAYNRPAIPSLIVNMNLL
jgi:hypothetical protein